MNQNVGEKIKEIRKTLKISQVELAKRTGMTQSWISRYERGEQMPGSKKLALIAKALRVPISAFFTESKQLEGVMEFLNEHLSDSEKQALKTILDRPANRDRLFQMMQLLNEGPQAVGNLLDNLLELNGHKDQ